MTQIKLHHSSKKSPCPVCDRSTDDRCAWDANYIYCYTVGRIPPAEANGRYFTGNYCDNGTDGPTSIAIYSLKEPKRNKPAPSYAKAFRASNKDINAAIVAIEVKVDELALMIAEGYETAASAGVALAAWCKEHRHDKFAAGRLLNEKLEAVKKMRADFSVNEDHKLVQDDRLLRDHLGDRLRFNELLLQPELDGELFSPAEARVELITRQDLPIKSCDKDIATLIYRLAKENGYSPIRDYLNRIHQEHGDDTQILEGFAERYFATPLPLHQAMVKRFLISAVARALEPGCKQDCTLILKGAQSCGKSSFLEIMASKPWFDDSYGNTNDKDERLKLHYSWILEWAELEVVFEKKSISHIKAFLSCSVDKIRPPYALSPEVLHRPSVIAGSTNEDQFLADTTGNRRYWVVPMNRKLNRAQLVAERDRIWAAAVALYRAGEQWWLTDEEEVLANEDRKQYEEVHPWAYSIEDYIQGLEQVSTREILTNALNIPVPRHNTPGQKKVAAIFKNLGWEQTAHPVAYKNRRTRVWRPKKI